MFGMDVSKQHTLKYFSNVACGNLGYDVRRKNVSPPVYATFLRSARPICGLLGLGQLLGPEMGESLVGALHLVQDLRSLLELWRSSSNSSHREVFNVRALGQQPVTVS